MDGSKQCLRAKRSARSKAKRNGASINADTEACVGHLHTIIGHMEHVSTNATLVLLGVITLVTTLDHETMQEVDRKGGIHPPGTGILSRSWGWGRTLLSWVGVRRRPARSIAPRARDIWSGCTAVRPFSSDASSNGSRKRAYTVLPGRDEHTWKGRTRRARVGLGPAPADGLQHVLRGETKSATLLTCRPFSLLQNNDTHPWERGWMSGVGAPRQLTRRCHNRSCRR